MEVEEEKKGPDDRCRGLGGKDSDRHDGDGQTTRAKGQQQENGARCGCCPGVKGRQAVQPPLAPNKEREQRRNRAWI